MSDPRSDSAGEDAAASNPRPSRFSRIWRASNHQVIGGLIVAAILAAVPVGYQVLKDRNDPPAAKPTPTGGASSSSGPDQSPAGVVRRYYGLINETRYREAWELVGYRDIFEGGFRQFEDGYEDTAHVAATITAETDDSVNVFLDAAHDNGEHVCFKGPAYVVRGIITSMNLPRVSCPAATSAG